MQQSSRTLATAACLAVIVGAAGAEPINDGDAQPGGSWYYNWGIQNAAGVDMLAFEMISSGDAFKGPVFTNIAISGWADSGVTGTTTLGAMSGSAIANNSTKNYRIHFEGVMSDPLQFLWYEFTGNQITWLGRITWNGSSMSWVTLNPNNTPHLTRNDFNNLNAIPLPAASAMAGLGLVAVGTRRRRA